MSQANISSHCDLLFPNKDSLFIYNEMRALIYRLTNLIIIIEEKKNDKEIYSPCRIGHNNVDSRFGLAALSADDTRKEYR